MKLPIVEKFNRVVDETRPMLPLTEEASRMLIGFLMDKGGKFDEVITADHPLLADAPQFEAFYKRIEGCTSLKMTLGAFMFVAMHIETFGDVTLYTYYLHRKSPPNSLVTITDCTMRLFPMGVFSEDQRHHLWENQKTSREEMRGYKQIALGHDNLLDYEVVWKQEEVKV